MLTSYFPPHSLSVNWPCLRANRSAQFRRRSNTHRRKNKRSLLSRYRRTANTKETQISRWKSTENTFLVEPRFVPFSLLQFSLLEIIKHSSFRFKTRVYKFEGRLRFIEQRRFETDNDIDIATKLGRESSRGAKSGWAKWQANFARLTPPPFSSRTFEKLCSRANLVREEGPSFHEASSRAQ